MDDPTMQFESSKFIFACSSAFAVGDGAFAAVPVCSACNVQLHQPPAQEKQCEL